MEVFEWVGEEADALSVHRKDVWRIRTAWPGIVTACSFRPRFEVC